MVKGRITIKNQLNILLTTLLLSIYACSETGTPNPEPEEADKSGVEVASSVSGVTLIKYGQEYQCITNAPEVDFTLNYEVGDVAWLNVDKGIANAKIGRLASSFDHSYFQAEPVEKLGKGTDDAIWWDGQALYGGAVNGENYCFVDTDVDGDFETVLLLKMDIQNLGAAYFIGKAVKTDGTDLSFADAKLALDQLD